MVREKVSYEDPLLNKYASNHGYQRVDGVTKSGSDKESRYAGKTYGETSDFTGKDYTTADYATKRWGGNKSVFGNSKYSGNKAFSQSPDFVKQQAYYSGKKNSGSGSAYSINDYDVSSASESNTGKVVTGNSTYAERNNVKNPVILPWKKQAELTDHKGVKGVSVVQTRALLGRSESE